MFGAAREGDRHGKRRPPTFNIRRNPTFINRDYPTCSKNPLARADHALTASATERD
jgi:hypothetical protein